VNDDGAPQPADVRRAARPYVVAVGVLFLAVIVYVSINTISNKPIGLKAGDRLPRFAAPSATGRLDKDANIDPASACRISRDDAIRICDYFDRPLVMVAWFTKGCDTCPRQLDTVEAVRHRFPDVGFVGLDIKDSLENAGKEVREHGWGFPMALDRDGAVSGLYGVRGGPTIFFAYPRGIMMVKVLGELDRQQLASRVEALVKVSGRLERAEQRK
jgi:peroxiredoxin